MLQTSTVNTRTAISEANIRTLLIQSNRKFNVARFARILQLQVTIKQHKYINADVKHLKKKKFNLTYATPLSNDSSDFVIQNE